MSISRRTFFGTAAGGAVAAPAMAKEAVASIGSIQRGLAGARVMGSAVKRLGGCDSKDELTWTEDAVSQMARNARCAESDAIMRHGDRALDPDLASFKSMSPSVKRHIQIDREMHAQLERYSQLYGDAFVSAAKRFLGV